MRKILLRTAYFTVLFISVACVADAQATRTWVSGVGDDVNQCSRTAPCKTFAGAISKTAVGGEISVLDPGGFGGVTITKSITLDGDGTLASILVSGTNGIVINGAGITVTIRNLSLFGIGGATLKRIIPVDRAPGGIAHVAISGFQSRVAITARKVTRGASATTPNNRVCAH